MSRIFNQDVSILGDLTVNPSNGAADFLTLDSVSKIVKYRTPAEVLADLGIPEDIEAYITDPTAIALLEDTSNWTQAGVYIGSPISGTFMGQKHYDATYFFEATNDDQWIRLIREEHPDDIPAYITDVPTMALLENTANWDIDGVYTGTAITGTFQGQKHYDAAYFFEAVQDNIWIRYPRA